MRRRPFIGLAITIALTFTVAKPGIAPAMWTSVNADKFQTQHVCQDGLVIDLATQDSSHTSITVWVAPSGVPDPANQWFTKQAVAVPSSPTTDSAEMQNTAFWAKRLGRNYKLTWTTPRTVGSQVVISVSGTATPAPFSPRTVESCSVNDRFDPFTVGYVWSHVIDSTVQVPYAPDQFWSYNSTLQTNTVTRTGTGSYTVRFPGLAAPGGNAHVTAYGSTPRVCKLGSPAWYSSGTAMLVNVRCFGPGPNGAPADAQFTASYTAGGGSGNTIAFAFADQPSNPGPYSPNVVYQYNNAGGAISVTRAGLGNYAVTMPNAYGPRPAGSVKVTAVGTTNTECKVSSWGPSGPAEVVHVLCFAGNGSLADQQFTVTYVDGTNLLGGNRTSDGYVWADGYDDTNYYQPSLYYQLSTTITLSGPVLIDSRYYDGPYDVLLPNQETMRDCCYDGDGKTSWDGGTAQASAYGSDSTHCQLGLWVDAQWFDLQGAPWKGRKVRVYCFDIAGNPAESRFTLQYTAQIQ